MRERLQKLLARAGIGSRRKNEELLKQGRVTVNGAVAKLGDSADPNEDDIKLDGETIRFQKYRYIMLNKPKGVLSSTEDGEGRETVRDLVQVDGHLFTVGRLDKPSEGLILLTNDGMLAHRLTHPRFGHTKTYRVWVERRPSVEDLKSWRQGIELDGEMTAPATVKVVDDSKYSVELQIIMREGRKRQIRRVAAALGHPVRRLLRTKIGPLTLKDLPPGEWRELSDREVKGLYKTARVPDPKDRHFNKGKEHRLMREPKAAGPGGRHRRRGPGRPRGGGPRRPGEGRGPRGPRGAGGPGRGNRSNSSRGRR